jgi:hypothetical protein
MLNVGKETVKRARRVLETGDAKLIEAVDRGEVSVTAAAFVAGLPEDEREAVIDAGPDAMKRRSNGSAGPRKRRGRGGSMAGKHLASEPEFEDALVAVELLLRKWDSMGGLKTIVSNWESQRRWRLSERLEDLGKILRKHGSELRHCGKQCS